MKISGFIKNSFIDYPGKIASVIFTQGCNMRCKFCHNHELIPTQATEGTFPEEEVLAYLKKARGFVDALVITGGEATLQTDLHEFIQKVKSLGLLVKLDTNGTRPDLLKKLLDEDLLDYVAMDVKTKLNLQAYQELVGEQFSGKQLHKVKESIDILKKSQVKVEFRTTLIKEIHQKEDILSIGEKLCTNHLYTLQPFYSNEVLDESFKSFTSYREEEMSGMLESCRTYLPNIRML